MRIRLSTPCIFTADTDLSARVFFKDIDNGDMFIFEDKVFIKRTSCFAVMVDPSEESEALFSSYEYVTPITVEYEGEE